ncbi:MAG: tetratricopeptide repeat protein [Candidatus Eremiobacteraeota bacterium]|nr:tetratricopeptide repeat protein [Candidatus Eremiobacteraeota bacterium]
MTNDKLDRITSVLIALITVFATMLAYIQVDAAHRDDRANRDSKRYALESFGLSVRGHAQSNFAYNQAFKGYYELGRLESLANTVDNEEAAGVYEKASEDVTRYTDLFSSEAPKNYYDKATGEVDLEHYEADAYVTRVAMLEQQFKAASDVKAAWDTKATTYIVHLTMLAVSLFLLGQATTTKGSFGKKTLLATGVGMSLMAGFWAFRVWAPAVYDLREAKGAIDHYAAGAGLDHRGLLKEAVAEYDQAIAAYPDYLDALLARGSDHLELEQWAEAAADFEKALRLNPNSPTVRARLCESYYEQGLFAQAIEQGKKAAAMAPDDVGVRNMLALALLASGDIEAGKAEYQNGMQTAARLVAEAHQQGAAPPAFIWETLDDSSLSLDELISAAEDGEGTPPKDKIPDPDKVVEAAEALHDELDGLAISLEYSGKPPEGKLEAEIGEIDFGLPRYDAKGELQSEVQPFPGDVFPAGTDEVVIEFPYGKMKDGSELVMRIFKDGQELPSWRMVEQWSLGSGDNETDYWYRVLSPGYSADTEFDPGQYFVEVFFDGHMAASSAFSIAESKE